MSIFNTIGKHLFPHLVDDGRESTIWNHSQSEKYSVPSTTEQGNDYAGSAIDPFGGISGLWNDLTGVTAQSREFAQQEYLQDKQNDYNKPVNQMQRMIDAGINPNTAAAGISQGGNESAQAPAVASNESGAAQGLSAAGAALGAVTGGIGSLASAGLAAAQAGEISALLDFKKNQFAADTAKTWIDAGMDRNMANYWGTKAAYAGIQERLDASQKIWSIKKVGKDIEKLNEDIKYRKEEIKLIGKQIDIAELKRRNDEIDLYFQQERKRIYGEVGVDITLPENQMLVEAYEAGTIDDVASAFGKGAYATSRAAYDADLHTIEERTKKRVTQELRGKIQEILKSQEVQLEVQKALKKYGAEVDAVSSVVDFVLQKVFHTGKSVSVGGIGVSQSNP